MMTGLLHLLFFFSGLGALVYQVVWVRVLGNVFGNTVYSAALVVAVFMLGLGGGGYLAGVWADRRYRQQPDSLLRSYGHIELAIAALGLGISLFLPHLGQLAAVVSSYSRDDHGWYVVSAASHTLRAAIAIGLLTPVTMLMGSTLTLLIRHVIRNETGVSGSRIGALYAVNTVGAAAGCVVADFLLVPGYGLRAAQLVAVFFNLAAGAGALYLGTRDARSTKSGSRRSLANVTRRSPKRRASQTRDPGSRIPDPESPFPDPRSPVLPIALALALAGCAAMGMEILWFRHFTILLGQFRAVFSTLLTIILLGIGAGAFTSGMLNRRIARPVELFMLTQALFVGTSLFGLFAADATPLEAAVRADAALAGALAPTVTMESGVRRTLAELWFNARPMLLEVAPCALLMGFSFPLGNAIVQRAEHTVGRRAGTLYLSNTVGAVTGSLVTGLLLLPTVGMQTSATILMIAAGLVIVTLYFAARRDARVSSPEPRIRSRGSQVLSVSFAGSSLVAVVALGLWLTLPSDHLLARALPRIAGDERLLARAEGLNEVVAVTEVPTSGRRLLTNGHPMSSTTQTAQRYMRALAHIPLLSHEDPQSALVIGFGVGNTTHATSLHPTMRRIEVADLSRDILEYAGYFAEVNQGVLKDPRVSVFVNDGRQHLQMQPAQSYDLITLEPPPIAYAGVAALYSRDFYALARTRLKPRGYVSQWLPAYQVPTTTTLAMIRAFIDVFPGTVLLSGAESELLLLGVNGPRIEIDPQCVAAALARAPSVHADLRRLDLASTTEIVGTFVSSARTLVEATREVAPVTDDHPRQEYGVMSLLNLGQAVPTSVIDLDDISSWCPTCFEGRKPTTDVPGLDVYMALLQQAYAASPDAVRRARALAPSGKRLVNGSAYLGSIVPESADLHNVLALSLASRGEVDEAIGEFREALRLSPDSALTHWHLGAALASRGVSDEAVEHLRRSIALNPTNGAVHNDLGVMLVREGRVHEAVHHFEQALQLDPRLADARDNLALATRARLKNSK